MKPKQHIAVFLWSGLLLTAPLNLFLKAPLESAYIHGLLVDYLLPKWYLSDFWVTALVVWYGWQLIQQPFSWSIVRKNWWWLGSILLLTAYSWQAEIPIVAAWQSGSWLCWAWLGRSLIMDATQPWRSRWFQWSLIAAVLLQSVVAGYQWWFQEALLPYWVLGESNLRAMSGVARSSLWGTQRTLAYGTTPHPNVLAGVVVSYLMLWSWLAPLAGVGGRGRRRWVSWLAWPAILMSGSVSAAAAWVSGQVATWARSRPSLARSWLVVLGLVVLVLPLGWTLVFNPQAELPRSDWQYSIARRSWLNTSSWIEWQTQPWLGLGPGLSSLAAERHHPPTEVVRFLQPPHHLIPLLLVEWGVVGVCWMFLGLWQLLKPMTSSQRVTFLTLTSWSWPILALDHYLITLHTGQILLTLTIAVSVIGSKSHGQLSQSIAASATQSQDR